MCGVAPLMIGVLFSSFAVLQLIVPSGRNVRFVLSEEYIQSWVHVVGAFVLAKHFSVDADDRGSRASLAKD